MKILDIYITEICNLNCEYCYVELKKKEVDGINVSEFTQRVNLLEYNQIKFFGGEPLLKWKELRQIIEAVYQKNDKIKFSIITNGLLITEDKLLFLREHNGSLTLSLHESSFKKILSKDFLRLLFSYRGIVGFVVLISYKNPSLAERVFFFLAEAGFTNFSISPLANIFRTDATFKQLQVTLAKIEDYSRVNKSIRFSDSEAIFLKNLSDDSYCKKTQVDKFGDKKNCSRFHREKELDDTQFVSDIYQIFEKYNGCSSCSHRWFCVCPIGRYFDNIDDAIDEEHLAKNFHRLNEIMITFLKNIVQIQGKRNYLTQNIDEIRFNLTEQCNLRCEYCYLEFTNKKLDETVGKNIINYYLEQLGEVKVISFFGGEPLLEFQLLKTLVEYAEKVAKNFNKKVSFRIATNALLFTKETIKFLTEHTFDIHVSINGTKQVHNMTRDKSYDILEQKLSLLKQTQVSNLVALYVVFPHTISSLEASIRNIIRLGFTHILFEIYLGNKYKWSEDSYQSLENALLKLWNIGLFKEIKIINLNSKKSKTVLDISTDGMIRDNSLEFFQTSLDFTPKKVLDSIFNKLR